MTIIEELEEYVREYMATSRDYHLQRAESNKEKDMSLASQIKGIFGRKDKEIASLKTQKANLEKNNKHLQSEIETLTKANAAYKSDLDEVGELLAELDKPLTKAKTAAKVADESIDLILWRINPHENPTHRT